MSTTVLQKLLALVRQGTAAIGSKTASRPVYRNDEWDYGKHGCPDCGFTEFYEGPSGGMNTNICCANPLCRSAFNTCFSLGYFARIPNTVFRSAFPGMPEESEAYLQLEIKKQLDSETADLLLTDS